MSKSLRPRAIPLICLMGAFCPILPTCAEAGDHNAKEIARVEDAYSQTFVTGDTRIAERLLVDDFVGFAPNGKTSDKAGILAAVRREPHLTSLKITALTIRLHGDTAIALGTEEDTNAGTPAVSHLRWLDTWKDTSGGWRLVSSAEIVPKP